MSCATLSVDRKGKLEIERTSVSEVFGLDARSGRTDPLLEHDYPLYTRHGQNAESPLLEFDDIPLWVKIFVVLCVVFAAVAFGSIAIAQSQAVQPPAGQ
jgi:hypothetical protein